MSKPLVYNYATAEAKIQKQAKEIIRLKKENISLKEAEPIERISENTIVVKYADYEDIGRIILTNGDIFCKMFYEDARQNDDSDYDSLVPDEYKTGDAVPKWNCTANFVAEQLERLRNMTDEERWDFFIKFFSPSADIPTEDYSDLPDIPRAYYEKIVGNMAHEINMLKEQLEDRPTKPILVKTSMILNDEDFERLRLQLIAQNKDIILLPAGVKECDRPSGEWIDLNGDGTTYKCSNCNETFCCNDNYCPSCGAYMGKKGGGE